MNNNKYLISVTPSTKQKKYPDPKLHTKDLLEIVLRQKGLNITLGEVLKGGTVSQVYEAKLDNKSVVVKHTEDLKPFDPTEFAINKEGHNVDTKILELLKDSKVKVPKVKYHFRDITTTIMEDLRIEGFELLINQILNKKLLLVSAKNVGGALASLSKEMKKFKKFTTNESTEQSIYERGLELRLVYPNSQEQYLELESTFISQNKHCVWPDGHPKNIFVTKEGNVAFIDFGRSIWGDQSFVLPNFLAHIVIYSLAGFIASDTVKQYIKDCIRSYKKYEMVDEDLLCRYLAMEVIHRMAGKWLQGVESKEQKTALYNFGLTVFDKKITRILDLLSLL